MPNYECPDDCGRTYQSIKAAMNCPCQSIDGYGYPRAVRGGEWLP